MILVTGGTGLVGSHLLLDLYKQGKKVRAVYRDKSRINSNSILVQIPDGYIDWIACDLSNTAQYDVLLDGVDTIIHCAAMVSFNPKNKQKMFDNNIGITTNLVNSALQKTDLKFIHLSSISVMENGYNSQKAIDENDHWTTDKNKSNYAISKHRSEMEVWRGIEEGLDAVIFNPTMILGEGNWNETSTRLVKTVANGLKFYSPGSNGYVDVHDVVKAISYAIDNKTPSKRYVVNGINLSFKSFFEQMAQALNVEAPTICPPRWLSEIGWRILAIVTKITGEEPFITKETTESAYSNKSFNGQLLHKELGIEYTPFTQTLNKIALAYKKK